MFKKILWTTAAAALLAVNTHAATFEVVEASSGNKYITLDGTIVENDDLEFKDLLLTLMADDKFNKTIILNSPGGRLEASLGIAKEVGEWGLTTAVTKNAKCHSGCALIWASGDRKMKHEEAVLGFHLAYIKLEAKDNPYKDYLEMEGWHQMIMAIEWQLLEEMVSYREVLDIKDFGAFMKGYMFTTKDIFWLPTPEQLDEAFNNVTVYGDN